MFTRPFFKQDAFLRSFQKESLLFQFSYLFIIFIFALPILFFGNYIFHFPVLLSHPFVYHSLFQICVVASFFFYIGHLLFSQKKRFPRVTVTHFLFILLSGVVVFASLFSYDPHFSFWGSFFRVDGLFFLFHVGILFFLLSSLIYRTEYFEFLMKTGIMFGVFSVLLSPILFLLNGDQPITFESLYALNAILNNGSFWAHYLLLLLIANSYFVLLYGMSFWNAIVYFIFSLLLYVSLSVSGVALMLLMYCVVLFIAYRKVLYAACSLLFLVILMFPARAYLVVRTFFESFSERIFLWTGAVKTVMLTRPFFGFGWGNGEIMWQYAESTYMSDIEMIFDKMHNVFIEMLVGAGIIGFCVFIVVWGRIFYSIFVHAYQKRDKRFLWLSIAFILHFIYAFFNIDSLMSYVFVSVFLAAFVLFSKEKRVHVSLYPQKLVVAGGVVGISFGAYAFVQTIQPLVAFSMIEQAWDKLLYTSPGFTKNVRDVQSTLTASFSFKQNNTPLLQHEIFVLNAISSRIPTTSDQKASIFSDMSKAYERFIAYHPMRAHPYFTYGFYTMRYTKDFDRASRLYQQAIQRAPFHPLYKREFVKVLVLRNEFEQARSLIDELKSVYGIKGVTEFYEGVIFFKTGRYESGVERIRESVAYYQPEDYEWNEVIEYVQQRYSDEKALVFLQEVLEVKKDHPLLYAYVMHFAKKKGDGSLFQLYQKRFEETIPTKSYHLAIYLIRLERAKK